MNTGSSNFKEEEKNETKLQPQNQIYSLEYSKIDGRG
jgi:hypothetical protein